MKKKIVILLIFLILFSIENVFAYTVNHSTLPLQLNTGNPSPYGEPSIKISVQGKSIPLIFDTGTEVAGVMLTPKALKGIKVKFTGKTICMGAYTGKKCYPEFIIPKLTIGNYTLNHVKGLLIKKIWGASNASNHKSTLAFQDGTVGYPLLSNFNLLVDFHHKKITLYNKTDLPSYVTHWVSLPFDHLYSIVRINGTPTIVHWDTGSNPSIISERIVNKHQLKQCLKPYAHKGCHRFVPESFMGIHGLRLPATWFNVIGSGYSLPYGATIGTNFYLHNTVFFNFKENRISIKPNT